MNETEVIKNFLMTAQAHFKAKVELLIAQQTADYPKSLSREKAIEGARWTAYHTRTLMKYLLEEYRG